MKHISSCLRYVRYKDLLRIAMLSMLLIHFTNLISQCNYNDSPDIPSCGSATCLLKTGLTVFNGSVGGRSDDGDAWFVEVPENNKVDKIEFDIFPEFIGPYSGSIQYDDVSVSISNSTPTSFTFHPEDKYAHFRVNIARLFGDFDWRVKVTTLPITIHSCNPSNCDFDDDPDYVGFWADSFCCPLTEEETQYTGTLGVTAFDSVDFIEVFVPEGYRMDGCNVKFTPLNAQLSADVEFLGEINHYEVFGGVCFTAPLLVGTTLPSSVYRIGFLNRNGKNFPFQWELEISQQKIAFTSWEGDSPDWFQNSHWSKGFPTSNKDVVITARGASELMQYGCSEAKTLEVNGQEFTVNGELTINPK